MKKLLLMVLIIAFCTITFGEGFQHIEYTVVDATNEFYGFDIGMTKEEVEGVFLTENMDRTLNNDEEVYYEIISNDGALFYTFDAIYQDLFGMTQVCVTKLGVSQIIFTCLQYIPEFEVAKNLFMRLYDQLRYDYDWGGPDSAGWNSNYYVDMYRVMGDRETILSGGRVSAVWYIGSDEDYISIGVERNVRMTEPSFTVTVGIHNNRYQAIETKEEE